MTRLPALRSSEVITILKKIGYTIDHQTGSHIILYKDGHYPISVPSHNRDLKKGTLANIIRIAGLGVEELLKLR